MDLQHTIPELKKVLRFLRPLLDAEEMLDSVVAFRKEEKLLQNNIIGLENKKQTIKNDVEQFEREAQSKKEGYGAEIVAVTKKVQAKAEELFKSVDEELTAKKAESKSLEEKNRNMTENIGSLKVQEAELKVKVDALKMVVTKTENMVASI